MDWIYNPYPDANPNPITKCVKPIHVKERKARNPLGCERTPRTHFQEEPKWCYAVPPGEEFEDKWKYDQVDRPLMENFESLRSKVAGDDARVKAQEARIKAFHDTKAMLAAQSTKDSVRESARSSARGSARSSVGGEDTGRSLASSRMSDSARHEMGSSRVPASNTGRSTCRSDNPFASARNSSRSQKDLSSFPASSLKGLQHDHPEVLAKMRAQRASKYVTSLANPLIPPSYNSISSRQGFFPAGTNTLHPVPSDDDKKNKKNKKKDSGKILVTSRNLDTAEMKESLNLLVSELAKTDSQIVRQELKIALAPKVKTFDKKQKSSKK